MTKEELKNKCKERAKIFQQAMESCHSSSPMDCIEWFADRIVELEKACDETQELLDKQIEATYKLDKENAEAKNLIEELASSLSVVGECGEEECELINKAQTFINKPIF